MEKAAFQELDREQGGGLREGSGPVSGRNTEIQEEQPDNEGRKWRESDKQGLRQSKVKSEKGEGKTNK